MLERGKVIQMEMQTVDGIEIFCLPDNAVCYASDGHVSPEKLLRCPMGRDYCCPECCENYDEVDLRGEANE